MYSRHIEHTTAIMATTPHQNPLPKSALSTPHQRNERSLHLRPLKHLSQLPPPPPPGPLQHPPQSHRPHRLNHQQPHQQTRLGYHPRYKPQRPPPPQLPSPRLRPHPPTTLQRRPHLIGTQNLSPLPPSSKAHSLPIALTTHANRRHQALLTVESAGCEGAQ